MIFQGQITVGIFELLLVRGFFYITSLAEEDPVSLTGIEICLMETQPDASQISDETIDLDLWSFLEWLLEQVGGEWTPEALSKTGAVYRVPDASERD